MNDTLVSAAIGAGGTLLLSAFSLGVTMYVRLSVLAEKVRYLSEQNREITRRLQMTRPPHDSESPEV